MSRSSKRENKRRGGTVRERWDQKFLNQVLDSQCGQKEEQQQLPTKEDQGCSCGSPPLAWYSLREIN